MPPPRKGATGKAKTTRKKMPSTGRARKGEKLLVTCTPIMTNYMMDNLAGTLHGMMLVDETTDGGYLQIMAVRVDERARKIYGSCQQMYEAAPYMFAPVPTE